MALPDKPKGSLTGGNDSYGNPYASTNRWRHQESTAYSKFAGQQQQRAQELRLKQDASEPGTSTTTDLADFINKSSRVEPSGEGVGGNYQPIMIAAGRTGSALSNDGPADDRNGAISGDGKKIACGPLLNYRRMNDGRWYGSVLIVVEGGGREVRFQPSLILKRLGAAHEIHSEDDHTSVSVTENDQGTQIESQRLYSDPRNTFWAFDIDVPVETTEVKYEYSVPGMRFSGEHKPRINNFYVPAASESMRIMFHSCNGFSVGTDEEAWSGACLWNDVMRKHQVVPYHCMVGGGDQIYNDGIRVHGPLRPWTDIRSPHKRQRYPFPEKLRTECDDYYLQNYLRWYNTEPFSTANGQIPQLNIWDDHDIIDGFGSYTDHFMRCDVFRGIGGTAHKYYMLFQHHLPPPPSTYCSDVPGHKDNSNTTPDPNQLIDTFVAPHKDDPSYIVGGKAGPYVAERSYSIYARLGARMALVGIDARIERTRHQINYPETYDLVFKRVTNELRAAAESEQPIKHLILLLGIPIAYPRLTWLENVLRSPLIGPLKLLNKRFGLGGDLFNKFDGGVDLLDDLDDHYTAKIHKAERATLIGRLQELSAEFSVRVTILGGDVHLAALGRFYSNPKLKIPVEHDNRYIANVVSSAIVNKPPPQAVANLLARRNKIHHLNRQTDETLLDFFDKDPGQSSKTANFNNCTMPSRNFASLTENSPNNPPLAENHLVNGSVNDDEAQFSKVKNGHSPLHKGELGAGTSHKAASVETHGHGNDGGLDIRINVEIDQHDSRGYTQGYGLTVPLLDYRRPQTPASGVASSSSSSSGGQLGH